METFAGIFFPAAKNMTQQYLSLIHIYYRDARNQLPKRYFAPSVVEEAGQAGMIDLGAVCIVCKFEVETSRIEVLRCV